MECKSPCFRYSINREQTPVTPHVAAVYITQKTQRNTSLETTRGDVATMRVTYYDVHLVMLVLVLRRASKHTPANCANKQSAAFPICYNSRL